MGPFIPYCEQYLPETGVSPFSPKNASRAPGQGPCSAYQLSKLFRMVDLVGVEHSKFSICLYLRRKMPFENTPILGRQILIYPVCRHTPKNAGRARRQSFWEARRFTKLFRMVDLVGVEHSKFSICLHLRRKLPLEIPRFENINIQGKAALY